MELYKNQVVLLFHRGLFRNQSIIELKEKKKEMEKNVEAARDALFDLEKAFAEKKKFLVFLNEWFLVADLFRGAISFF